jgi:predicted RNA-binding protein YlqC (UPF0109 family)
MNRRKAVEIALDPGDGGAVIGRKHCDLRAVFAVG